MHRNVEDPYRSSKPTRRRRPVNIFWWISAVAVVLVIGLVFFPREYKGLSFWESLYYTIRLFILEHDLPRFPRSWPLVFIHFAAPAIALSAVWTAIKRLFHLTPGLWTRWLSNHVLVCGVGRAGKVIAAALKRKGVRVVGVDLGPAEQFDEWRAESGVPMIYGSFYSRSVLQRGGAARARSILFATGDDLANLEGAVGAYDWLRSTRGRPRIIWTHVTNEKLRYTSRDAVRTAGSVSVRFFDIYRIAATRMIAKYFDHQTRRGVNEVTIIGFGKFGRDLLEVLIRDLVDDEGFGIRVIDLRDRASEVASVAAENGIPDRVSFQRADMHELHLEEAADKAFFLCTDDDLGNLTSAMMLAAGVDATHIYVRMAKWPMSAVAEHLGEERGVVFININQLVLQGIGDLPGIFSRATSDDLERIYE